MKSIAYHLRQDGKYFRVVIHLYAMGDEDLSSEAEVASFIIKTASDDIELAKQVIDSWLAIRILSVPRYWEYTMESVISYVLSHLPYKFMYSLPEGEYINIHNELNNYDIDNVADFVDELDIPQLHSAIEHSFNQQFCRVRYGGQYNTRFNTRPELWFRISSIGYNWANTIYEFVTNFKNAHDVEEISICRDAESDDTESETFYKAKDGALYLHMPIDEYLTEEHEHSVVFASVNSGVYRNIRSRLNMGNTLHTILSDLSYEGIDIDENRIWDQFVRDERNNCQSVKE